MRKILILDDNLTICLMLKSWLTKQGYKAETATRADEAIKMVKDEAYDLILSDIRMPDIDGFEFLSWLKRYDSDILVIMMTSYSDIDTAVESIKMGAADYIPKPIDPDVLFKKIDDAFKDFDNQKKALELQRGFIKPDGVNFTAILEKMMQTIQDESHLLIMGEPGTGKSTAARFIYSKGVKYGKAFSMFDFQLSASNSMHESEVYRNALQKSLEDSRGGVLYMKNLRKPCLDTQLILIDLLSRKNTNGDSIQLLVATTESKEQLKSNLLPKLATFLLNSYIELPTLQGNKRAIEFYSQHFLQLANRELQKKTSRIDQEVFDAFYEHPFHSNIQELKNLIFKACLLTSGNTISKDILPVLFQKSNIYVAQEVEGLTKASVKLKKENFEKEKIMEALEISKGNKTMASTILNIDRKTLYNKIRLYNIELN